jgi:hypothetical protein
MLIVSFVGVAYGQNQRGVAVYPAQVDLGKVKPGFSTFIEVTVVNRGSEPVDIVANVEEGRGAGWVSVSDESFSLSPQQERDVKINIAIPEDARPDLYDLSIVFREVSKLEAGVGAVSATNLRLRFTVSGVVISSFGALDAEKPNPIEIRLILANFYDKPVSSRVKIQILDSTGSILTTFEEVGIAEPYPEPSASFGFLWDTENVEMGDYVAKALVEVNDARLEAEDPFTVGLIKGEILSFEAVDVVQGEVTTFTIKIKNIGNLPLPVEARVVVKDERGNVYADIKEVAKIPRFKTEDLIMTWDTGFPEKAPIGKYTAQLEIIYGHDHTVLQTTFEVKRPLIHYVIAVTTITAIVMVVISLLRRRKRLKGVSEPVRSPKYS